MGDAVLYILIALSSVGGLAIVAVGYLLFMPEKAEKVFGWFAGLVAKVVRKVDRTAVAYKVQGEINSARAELMRDAPDDILDRKLKIKWADAERAEALVKEGEVLVVMQRSPHHEENVAHAVMAYLPKAMLTRARPYLDKDRMRAADLIVAKAVLCHENAAIGALPVFFEHHLDPARDESHDLKEKITQLDEIDCEGWLLRVLLTEYRQLGNQLHPGEPTDASPLDAEEFARWLYRLASREPGQPSSLTYFGRYFRVAVTWVGIRGRLAEEGLRPYRRRVKRLLYRDRMDAVYLMARDNNISAVERLADDLESDARVASVTRHVYGLRSDFKKRRSLQRDRAIVVCLRRRQAGDGDAPVPDAAEEDDELPEERYEPDFGQQPDQEGAEEPRAPVA